MAQDRSAKGSPRSATGKHGTGDPHRWVIDKLEETTAAIEHDGDRVFNIPRSLIPADAREGDVLDVRIATTGDAGRERVSVDVRVDRAATAAAMKASVRQVKRTPGGNDRGGDIVL